jgi:hypothetical protein
MVVQTVQSRSAIALARAIDSRRRVTSHPVAFHKLEAEHPTVDAAETALDAATNYFR